MKLIIKLLLTAVLVYFLANFLPGVSVNSLGTAVVVAIVLALLNTFVKPVLIFMTLPATLITLGLFLLVINALVILMCEYFVSGFEVSSFWTALLFSLILSIFQSFLYSFADKYEKT
ncbi:MAG: phage holin family protein [Flavobacteriaceae bacterium]